MILNKVVRAAIERRIAAIERSLASIEGLFVERDGDKVRIRGRRLLKRSIDDARLRFAGLMR